jgi:hypothetical protein
MAPASSQFLVLHVGAKFTTATPSGADPGRDVAMRIIRHGPVMLAASQARAAKAGGTAAARVVRAAARQVVERAQLDPLLGGPCAVLGSSDIARAAIALGSSGRSRASVEEIHGATDALAETWVEATAGEKPDPWAESMMVGAAVLGAILDWLGATEIATEVEPAREQTSIVD